MSQSMTLSRAPSEIGQPTGTDDSPRVAVGEDRLRGYALFLEKLKDPGAAPIVSRVKLFVSRFPLDLKREAAAERLHTFISRLEDELMRTDVFANKSEEEQTNAKEGLEKLILKPLHQHFFTIDPNDKLIDEQLSAKILRIGPSISLHAHLHGPAEFTDDSLLELAIQEFQRIDSYRAPRDKLQCILNGFRVIRHALDTTIGVSQWGADQLLPLCIYSIVRANPPSLQSNVNFISSFRHPSRMRGEDEYLLMQMDIAIKDILNIDELLLKSPSDLTVADIANMYVKYNKCVALRGSSVSDENSVNFNSPLLGATHWRVGDQLSDFVSAYKQLTEQYGERLFHSS